MSNAEQSTEHFLLSIMEHSKDGKPDWDKIIQDCAIPTVGAAKTKLYRLRAKFSGNGNTADTQAVTKGGSHDPSSVTKTNQKTTSKAGRGRPRKTKVSPNTANELSGEMHTRANEDDDKGQAGEGEVKVELDLEV